MPPLAPTEQIHTLAPSSLTEVFEDTLKRVPSVEKYVPDQERQKKVLESLPKDLSREMMAYILDHYISEEKYNNKRIPTLKDIVAGRLFELLVVNDATLLQKETNKNRQNIKDELLGLANNPDRFGLGTKLGPFRNPDLIDVTISGDGVLHINSLGEVKLGLLDHRGIDQISKNGHRRGMKNLANYINFEPNLQEVGLKSLGLERRNRKKINRKFVDVDDNALQILYVPANRDLSSINNLIHSRNFSRDEYASVTAVFNDPNIRIRKAAFSVEEVHALTGSLLEQLEKEFPDNMSALHKYVNAHNGGGK